jgi:hypothetical protein
MGRLANFLLRPCCDKQQTCLSGWGLPFCALALACLLYAAGVASVQAHEGAQRPPMKIDELVERLEAAYPWTPEKVESVLGADLTITTDDENIVSHEASHITYEGLLIDNVELRLGKPAMDTVRLIFDVSEKAVCITQESIKETYPGGERSVIPQPHSLDGGRIVYSIKRSWGEIAFGFKCLIRPDCLADIVFIPEGK